MKILLTGGGTAGHLLPLLIVVEELRKRDPEAQFLFVGPRSDFNESLAAYGIEVREVEAGKWRRYLSLKNLSDLFRTLVGIDEAIFYMLKFRPDAVLSKGGFASVPAVLGAWMLRLPVLTHESDTVPGWANRLIGRCADKVFISFPGAERYFTKNKVILSGNPIREELLAGDRARAKEIFELHEEMPTLLVFGGSQGAQHINQFLLGVVGDVLEKYQVIHVCGNNNYDELKQKVDGLPTALKRRYRIYPYLKEEMKDAFALADLVVSRAGANSLAEIIALRKPALVIPLPSAANNHQYLNAKYFAEADLVLMAEEKELAGGKLLDRLEELDGRREELAANLKRYDEELGGKRPAEIIAEEVFKYGQNKR